MIDDLHALVTLIPNLSRDGDCLRVVLDGVREVTEVLIDVSEIPENDCPRYALFPISLAMLIACWKYSMAFG